VEASGAGSVPGAAAVPGSVEASGAGSVPGDVAVPGGSPAGAFDGSGLPVVRAAPSAPARAVERARRVPLARGAEALDLAAAGRCERAEPERPDAALVVARGRAGGVAGASGSAAGAGRASSAATRSRSDSTSARRARTSSERRMSSIASRTRPATETTSSMSSCARPRVPSLVAWSVRSNALMRPSAGPPPRSASPASFPFFLSFFLGTRSVYASMSLQVLRPHEPVAERVLLPGDPGRALRLAQRLLDAPRMLNHHRGLWGYTGAGADGKLLTIQSTGMGGPSAAIVAEELVALGARRLVRIGTCGALVDGAALGSLVVATAALPGDGTSRALGAAGPLPADPALLAGLRGAAGDALAGPVASADLFYDPDAARAAGWTAAGAVAVEMGAAALFAVAARHGAAAACVCLVSDLLASGSRERITPAALEAAEPELGRTGLAAFA